jgi:hypothetical protein
LIDGRDQTLYLLRLELPPTTRKRATEKRIEDKKRRNDNKVGQDTEQMQIGPITVGVLERPRREE